jgi:hypothetical protein
VDPRRLILALLILAFSAPDASVLAARARPSDRPIDGPKALVERLEKPRHA